MATTQEQIRQILEREADFLARQLEARGGDKEKAIALFEASVRPGLLTTLENAACLNLTYPNIRGGGVL
ncbi:hypothetical protein D3C87_1200360 [compost metagenome]